MSTPLYFYRYSILSTFISLWVVVCAQTRSNGYTVNAMCRTLIFFPSYLSMPHKKIPH